MIIMPIITILMMTFGGRSKIFGIVIILAYVASAWFLHEALGHNGTEGYGFFGPYGCVVPESAEKDQDILSNLVTWGSVSGLSAMTMAMIHLLSKRTDEKPHSWMLEHKATPNNRYVSMYVICKDGYSFTQ